MIIFSYVKSRTLKKEVIMKNLLFLVFFSPLFGLAQPSSAQYLIEEVYKFEIVKEQDCYRVDSTFLFELFERAYEFDWYMPVKRNLDLYAPTLYGDYKFFLDEAYQRDDLVIGTGHFFDEKGAKKNFTLIFLLAETSDDHWKFLHFCVSEEPPVLQYIEEDNFNCVNGNHGIVPAGTKKGDTRSFY